MTETEQACPGKALQQDRVQINQDVGDEEVERPTKPLDPERVDHDQHPADEEREMPPLTGVHAINEGAQRCLVPEDAVVRLVPPQPAIHQVAIGDPTFEGADTEDAVASPA